MSSRTVLHIAIHAAAAAKPLAWYLSLLRRTLSRQWPAYEFRKLVKMLWTILLILVVLWLLGFGVFQVLGSLIHILLVVALVVLVLQLVSGRRAV